MAGELGKGSRKSEEPTRQRRVYTGSMDVPMREKKVDLFSFWIGSRRRRTHVFAVRGWPPNARCIGQDGGMRGWWIGTNDISNEKVCNLSKLYHIRNPVCSQPRRRMAQVGYGEMVEQMDLFLPSLMDCREQRWGPHVCRKCVPRWSWSKWISPAGREWPRRTFYVSDDYLFCLWWALMNFDGDPSEG